ncbi:DUF998 domain-containing protein [Agromyces sp. SYSU K20354]|uniref:DUF998 domain-containing protein n=1 Tax=Agromyces cavernae TaxID=2898659 RepID=UPI001E47E84F|nr:DUF998 domain-containing protein [Agromyces cavernae]MCD2441057.1 DUF998 domain-containing protein [Agromyces cavernae]
MSRTATATETAATVREPASILRVLRNPAATAESLESTALVLGAAVFVVGGVIAWISFLGRDLAIAGEGSLGQYVAIGSVAVTLLAFVLGRIALRRRADESDASGDALPGLETPGVKIHWFDLTAIAVAHAVIALLGWIGLSDLLERSFQGAVVFTLPGALLAGVAFAVTAYAVFLSSAHLTPMLLSFVLALFLVVGALASMLSASDPQWWQENLSALGMTDDISSLAFNVTLIIAGAIVTTIARYATASVPVTTAAEVRGRNIVRVGLILIGIFLACVGIFPVDRFFLVHNTVATGMAVVFAVVVIGLRWFIPSMPRVFILLGYVYVGVIAMLGVFFATGYYNLTAVELVAGVLIFSWIIVFLRSSGAMHTQPRAVPAA